MGSKKEALQTDKLDKIEKLMGDKLIKESVTLDYKKKQIVAILPRGKKEYLISSKQVTAKLLRDGRNVNDMGDSKACMEEIL